MLMFRRHFADAVDAAADYCFAAYFDFAADAADTRLPLLATFDARIA